MKCSAFERVHKLGFVNNFQRQEAFDKRRHVLKDGSQY